MIKAYAGMTCEEIYEAALKDWRFTTRGIIYSEETQRRLLETVARLWTDFATERVSVEEFCDGFYTWLDSFYETTLRATRYFREEDIPSWARKVRDFWWRAKFSFTEEEKKEILIELTPTQDWLRLNFINAAKVLETYARKAPKLAKSPAFARLVRQIILTERFDVGRRGFIEFLLPVTKFVEGIDLRSFALDPEFAAYAFYALSKLKDGRFVAEAETVLRENPKWSGLYRKRLERYIKRYKPAEG
jgi:hypothetical protein